MKTAKCPKCNGTGRVPDDRAIGQEMRRLREGKGVSVRSLAKRLEISAPYLSDLELGRRHWNLEKIRAFKATLEEL